MGIYIKGMKKPKECGHHLDTYKTVLSCPLARANGACKLQEYTGRRRPNFKEQYKHCPMLGVPDHGPLIDVDRLKEFIESYNRGSQEDFRIPHVIPADKEEEKP